MPGALGLVAPGAGSLRLHERLGLHLGPVTTSSSSSSSTTPHHIGVGLVALGIQLEDQGRPRGLDARVGHIRARRIQRGGGGGRGVWETRPDGPLVRHVVVVAQRRRLVGVRRLVSGALLVLFGDDDERLFARIPLGPLHHVDQAVGGGLHVQRPLEDTRGVSPKRELGAPTDVHVVAQDEAPSVDQRDLSPGQEDVGVLLGGGQGKARLKHAENIIVTDSVGGGIDAGVPDSTETLVLPAANLIQPTVQFHLQEDSYQSTT
ncbi:hypothetical protein EYF80_045132 [Liparis tanakae]|uniref:Uncharacterized protein n=1 Tax=Liparis tanakae TaxID=230148 RepID=A0A4Z2FTV6_9TELE|nr:hypothetical protein EYF80_045132 [Liparis tanakae]